jgi:cytochrome c nitrite reductase small subunit
MIPWPALSRLQWTLVAVLFGVLLGLGLFTFGYAEGASYLSTDPKACVNCHIMRSEYDAWQKASHHGVATCVDCHLPATLPEKYLAKALNGWNHSKAFTLQDFPEPIRITPRNADLLQENCLRCHGDLVHDLLTGRQGEADALRCVHCHASVGHGEPVGLGGPDRGEHETGWSEGASK